MLRRQQQFHLQVLQVVDALLLCLSLGIAHQIRYRILPEMPQFDFGQIYSFDTYLWLWAVILPASPLILESQGVYGGVVPLRHTQMLSKMARGVFFLWLLLLTVVIFLRIPQSEVSRVVYLLFLPIGVAMLLLRETVYRQWIRNRGRSSLNRQQVLICGSTSDLQRWRASVDLLPGQDLLVCGGVDLRSDTINELIRQIHRESVDVVIFEFNHDLMAEQNKAIQACELEGVEVWITADFVHTKLTRPQFDEMMGRSLLVYRSTPEISWQLLAKRVIDQVLAILMLVGLLPLMALVALLIRLSSTDTVIFSQQRSGRYGRPFTMYKFRTMVSDAEQQQHELKSHNMMKGPVFKLSEDPRVTPLGRFLRKFSVDELPQLWNVLRGEMSLVGPRPLPLYETESFIDHSQRRRMSVKPGITCLWQIAGRNEITDFTDWVRLDLEYIDGWSLLLDLKILLLTIPAVLQARGSK